MSTHPPVDDIESLRSTFQDVLEAAYANGVDLEGSLTIRTSEQTPNWEVQVWEVE